MAIKTKEQIKQNNRVLLERYRDIVKRGRVSVPEYIVERRNIGRDEEDTRRMSVPSSNIEAALKFKKQPLLFDLVMEVLSRVLIMPKVTDGDKPGTKVMTMVVPNKNKLHVYTRSVIEQKLNPLFTNRTLTKPLYKHYLKLNELSAIQRPDRSRDPRFS